MLKNIVLKNFKCFECMNVELSYLNVFSGINSMGKSSVIQSLLLLRQSFEKKSIKKGIYLNGVYTNIGTGYELLYRQAKTESIGIELKTDHFDILNEYKYERDNVFLSKTNHNDNKNIVLEEESLFSKNFTYISSERISPKRFYLSSYYDIYEEDQIGCKGDFLADYMAEKGSTLKVSNSKLIIPEVKSDFLSFQLDAWLKKIGVDVSLHAEKLKRTGTVSLEYKVGGDSFTPLNVGYGITYVAPVVLALLKAKNGDLVIIENPEVYLHPKGQRILGEMISLAASGGVQVIIETHSDHLLNGIRIAVKQNKIANSFTKLIFFFKDQVHDEELGEIVVSKKVCPQILENGQLSSWPDGFFDEWDKALEELF